MRTSSPFYRRPSAFLTFFLLCIQHLKLIDSKDPQKNKSDKCAGREKECKSSELNNNKNDNQCSLYMAPSSIPGAGFGIYTTKTIKSNQPIQNYPSAPSIPVVDDFAHYGNKDPVVAHENYYWQSDGYGNFEGDEVEVE